jgi:hypothetical protein
MQNTKLDSAINRISNRRLRTAVYVIAFMLIGFALPWWSILLIAGLIGWVEHGLLRSMLAALIACFLAWFVLTFAFDLMNGFRISTRIGGLVGLPIPVIANILSATLGGVVAALAAATTNQLRITLQLVRASR